eukprot:352989-Chlamydomonas_euryale.AAC.4
MQSPCLCGHPSDTWPSGRRKTTRLQGSRLMATGWGAEASIGCRWWHGRFGASCAVVSHLTAPWNSESG